MKRLLACVMFGLSTCSATALAEADKMFDLTGNMNFNTNYVWRGISQSNNMPSVQGSMTLSWVKPGIYFNLWGSNVSFDDNGRFENNVQSFRRATLELDTTLGIANKINDDWSYDVNVVRYNYPKTDAIEWNEIAGSLTYKYFTAKVTHSSDVFDLDASGTYYNLAVNYPIPCEWLKVKDLTIGASIGHYHISNDTRNPSGQTHIYDSYNDYSVWINKKFYDHFTIALQWTGTNDDFFNQNVLGNTFNYLQDDHLILSIGATF